MAILNYTTQIKAEKTIGEIQKLLAKAGAQAVLTEYDDNGVPSAVSFRLITGNGPIFFRLPARIDRIYVVLQRDKSIRPYMRTRDQAARVSWRIIKDWIAAQLALVQAEQAEMVEVFLPYAQGPDGKTAYEQIQDGGFAKLTHSNA